MTHGVYNSFKNNDVISNVECSISNLSVDLIPAIVAGSIGKFASAIAADNGL